VIRSLLDERLGRLGLDDGRERREAIRQTSGLFVGYPDWPEWLERFRGASTDERLREVSRLFCRLRRLLDRGHRRCCRPAIVSLNIKHFPMVKQLRAP
jgi:hypothetical protein